MCKAEEMVHDKPHCSHADNNDILCLKHLWAHAMPRVGNLTEEKSLCVDLDLIYGDFGSHPVSKMRCSNFLLMT
jgi:hypothetical protein